MPYKFVELAGAPLYAEIPQINPLRWEVLYKKGNTFTLQTGKFRCKDFFNDLVAARKGYKMCIYGFNCADITTNRAGVWLRLSEIQDYQQFVSNINSTLNVFYAGTYVPLITMEQLDTTTVLMFLPSHFFSNTYKISLCTYMIRLCNYGVVFGSFKEALTSLASQEDGAIQDSGKALALDWMLDVPSTYDKYWYYAGKEYNSVKQPVPNVAVVHNNGVHNWSTHIANTI